MPKFWSAVITLILSGNLFAYSKTISLVPSELKSSPIIYSKGKWEENEYSIEFYDRYLNFTFIGKKLTHNRIQLKFPESEKDIFIL